MDMVTVPGRVRVHGHRAEPYERASVPPTYNDLLASNKNILNTWEMGPEMVPSNQLWLHEQVDSLMAVVAQQNKMINALSTKVLAHVGSLNITA